MAMSVAPMWQAQTDGDERADRIRAALARLPVGRALTPHEAARVAEGKAHVAAGGRGRSTDEVIAAARARRP